MTNSKESAPKTRCAIYCRKSTDEGLEQEFHSLDAQREAAEAFIASQKNEGWVCLPEQYDDGGFSGANTPTDRQTAESSERAICTAVAFGLLRLSRAQSIRPLCGPSIIWKVSWR